MDNLKEIQSIASSYRILYVEDDKDMANLLIKYLSNFFREVIYAENGEEALVLYKKDYFELVITDIEMPQKNGLDLSFEIKRIDKNQNIIITSAYSDLSKFQSSIKLGIDGYLVKPINYVDMNNLLLKLVLNIKKDKELISNKKKIEQAVKQVEKKNAQLNEYIDILDHVSIVSKIDLDGNITYVNKFFCDVSGYTEEELIGKNHSIIRHPEMPKSIFDDLLRTILKGQNWVGTIKNKNKQDEVYFVHITVIPIYEDNSEDLKEYMGIGFLATKEEMEKREFKKKVMTNYQEYRKNSVLNDKKIENLNIKIKDLLSNQQYVKDYNIKLEEKNLRLLAQIDYYEKEHLNMDDHRKKTIGRIDNRINNLEESNKKLKVSLNKKEKELEFISKDYDNKKNKIKDLLEHLDIQRKIILDLKNTIKEISEKE